MTVRLMVDSDSDQVRELRLLLWPDDDDDDVGADETVWVWVEPNEAVGGFVTASIRPWADGCESSPVPYVEGWFVREHLRRRGVGRALVAAVEEWARAQGFTELGSDALLENVVSIEAHQRLGFDATSRLQCFSKQLCETVGSATDAPGA